MQHPHGTHCDSGRTPHTGNPGDAEGCGGTGTACRPGVIPPAMGLAPRRASAAVARVVAGVAVLLLSLPRSTDCFLAPSPTLPRGAPGLFGPACGGARGLGALRGAAGRRGGFVAGGSLLMALAGKNAGGKREGKADGPASGVRESLDVPRPQHKGGPAPDVPEEEAFFGAWFQEGGGVLPENKSQRKYREQDEWVAWLNDGFPAMLKTMSGLTDSRASARKAAVGQLLKCAENHPAGPTAPWAVAALAGRLEDDSACVREAAVKGLVKVSEKGNKQVVLAMACLIEEETAVTVKKAALMALTRLARRGDQEAVAPVLRVLQRVQGHERGDFFAPDMSRMVNKHAVKALGTLAGRGNEEALKALHVRILDDPEPSVREAAARSVGNIADADDARSMAALMLCMEDEDEGVRRTAFKSVRAMLRRQKEEYLGEESEECDDGDCELSEDEDEDEQDDFAEKECGASRLWLLPGVWGG